MQTVPYQKDGQTFYTVPSNILGTTYGSTDGAVSSFYLNNNPISAEQYYAGTGRGAPTGVYWVGKDGQRWVKDASGTRAVGDYTDGANSYWSGKGYYGINDPNVLGTSMVGSNPYSTTGSGTATYRPAYDPNQVALYDQGINTLRASEARLGNQEGIALGNIEQQYGVRKNELDTGLQNSQNTYNTQGIQNQQQLRSNRNTITDQASQGLRGLYRTLGAAGALGSSSRLMADQAVQDVATAQNSGAGGTYAENQQALDTNWGNYQNEDKTNRKKLDEWKASQHNSVKAQSLTNKQNILNKIAEMTTARASYMGGNGAAAGQTYLDQANGLNAQIDELGRFNPIYDGKTPIYNAPSLSSYNTGRGPGIAVGGGYNPAQTGINEIYGLTQKKDRKQPNY